ncbi:Ig-like domain-containing protein, partial [Paraconexibacter sp.]|uniref:Ig-like domain-containing protein n=1 Tax=Paraconexibacter sp. TaxID=2949640 RepID=UPI003561E994
MAESTTSAATAAPRTSTVAQSTAAPPAGAAKRTYRSLRSVGLTVRSASLKSRTLRVKVTATRKLWLRFAIVRGSKQLGSAKHSVPRGTTSLKLLLNQKSRGSNLRLRVTARYRERRTRRNIRGRQRVGVEIIDLPKVEPKPPPTPQPSAPVTGQSGPATPANAAPTALALTNANVAENAPVNTTVGNLAGTDPDPADTLTYGFAAGPGSQDNASFVLSDGTLRTGAVFDFEAKSSYSVRLWVSDGRGGTFEQAFTITVTDAAEPPTAVALSSSTVPENQPTGTPVGLLSATDPDAGDTAGFSLVAGPGATDNASFAIVGNELRTAAPLNFEAGAVRSVRVRATDGAGGVFEQVLSISVGDINDPPTNVVLSGTSVAENQPSGTTVGSLSALDEDAGATATFALVPGAGDADNASFEIVGSTLRTAAVFDAETKSTYAVRIRADDGAGGAFTRTFTIDVTDVDDPAIARDDSATVTEDDPATAIPVLGNDSDQDDPLSIVSVSDPAGGTAVITGGGSGLTYRPDADYCNDPPGSALDTFTYTLGGPGGETATVTMTVTCVNDAPVVTTTSGPVTYTEGSPATPVDPGVTVVDVDSTIASATVSIGAGFDAAQDVLSYLSPLGNPVTGSYDAVTGVMTLTGPGTPAQFADALREVRYANTSNAPSTTTRTVTFVVNDGTVPSAPASRDIAVSATDNAPETTTSGGSLAYTEDAPAAAIDTGVTVTDPDSANLTGATVKITGGYVTGEDLLALPAQPAITGVFTPGDGTLALSGTATVAAYQAALRAVTYRNTSDTPDAAPRTVTFAARDATGFGTAATRGITITPVDDPPVAVDDDATVTEDAAATAVPVLSNDTDVDGGTKLIGSVTQPANGTVVITGGGTGLTYAPDADSCNAPPGTTPDTFTYTLNGGSSATVSMTVTCVDDAPVAVDDDATVTEDAGATAVPVLSNDTDPDGGTKLIGSVTQPANGTVV